MNQLYTNVYVDNWESESVSKLQLFVMMKGNDDYPDAIDMLSPAYSQLYDSYAWGTGIKRLILDERALTDADKQLTIYKNLFYSAVIDFKNVMFTNFSNNRDFYIYYSEGSKKEGEYIDHSLDFCDSGYHYFEFRGEDANDHTIQELCKFIALVTTVSRNEEGGNEAIPMCSGGELSVSRHKEVIKMKLMPVNSIDLYSQFLVDMLGNNTMDMIIDAKK